MEPSPGYEYHPDECLCENVIVKDLTGTWSGLSHCVCYDCGKEWVE